MGDLTGILRDHCRLMGWGVAVAVAPMQRVSALGWERHAEMRTGFPNASVLGFGAQQLASNQAVVTELGPRIAGAVGMERDCQSARELGLEIALVVVSEKVYGNERAPRLKMAAVLVT
jgi:hypothetical protein